MVTYERPDNPPYWLVGEVLNVDHSNPVLETHRFGSYDFRDGKTLARCTWLPAYIDPKDGMQVYTNRPMGRYLPILDLLDFADVISRDFFLTNKGLLPQEVARAVKNKSD